MKNRFRRYILLLLCSFLLFCCANTKDLNATTSELLKVAATELGLNERAEVNCRYKKGEWTAEEAVNTWIT